MRQPRPDHMTVMKFSQRRNDAGGLLMYAEQCVAVLQDMADLLDAHDHSLEGAPDDADIREYVGKQLRRLGIKPRERATRPPIITEDLDTPITVRIYGSPTPARRRRGR